MIIVENKNTFEDLLGLEIETEDKFLNKKLNSHVCYSGGGGGGQKQQDIAPTLRPYVTDVLSRAKGQVDAPYQAYPGERVVGFTPQELAAQQGIQQMAGQYGLASMAPGLTSSAAYYNPAYSYLGQTGQALGVGAGALAESGDIQRNAARAIGLDEVGKFGLTGEDIQKYIDPYQQAVTDIDKRQARQDALQTAQAIGAKSAGAGAFGGSRQAILESQAASDLGTRLADIQTRGSQAAYQQALQTAAQQQQVGLGEAAAQRAREQQLGAGIAGLAGQYGQLAGGLGSLSGQYGSLGQQALGQGYRELGYLSGVGEAQRGLGQQRADIAFGEFQQQRDYPMRQLERYAGMAFGVPSGYLQQQQAMPSGFQQAVGGLTAAAGLGRGLGFFKEGGDIGKGGLSTVYRKAGSSILEDLSLSEAYQRYLELAGQRKPFDKEKEEQRIKEDKGFAIAQLGANILAADPSRGALAAIGQAAPSAIQQLSALEKERTGLDEAGRRAEMEELLLEAGIIEKLREASEAGTVDISGFTGLTDTEFSNVESAVSELQKPGVKTFLDKPPGERIGLRQQANQLALEEAKQGLLTNVIEFQDSIRRNYQDLLLTPFSEKILNNDDGGNNNKPPRKEKTYQDIAREREEEKRRRKEEESNTGITR